MKVMVIGASGLVGKPLFREARIRHQALGTYYQNPGEGMTQLDITDRDHVFRELHKFQPDWVMLPAYIPLVDWCEEHTSEAARVNIYGVQNVIDACIKTGAGLFFYATDYVFDGTQGPYLETDVTNPLNVYGAHKLANEQYIIRNMTKFIIARTAWVYDLDPRGRNMVVRYISALQKGEILHLASDQSSNPTYAQDLAPVSLELLESGKTGLFHVAGPDIFSRYEFGLAIADIFGYSYDQIQPIKIADMTQIVPRPLQGGLRIEKLIDTLGHEPMTTKAALDDIKKRMVQA